MPCHPSLFYTMLRHTMLCHTKLCHATPCCAIPCEAMPYLAMPCCAVSSNAILCHSVPCCSVPCSVTPCCTKPCRAVLRCPVQGGGALTATSPGTTWMQEILTLLYSGGDAQPAKTIPNWERAPWLEQIHFRSSLQDTATHRLITSHLPARVLGPRLQGSKAKVRGPPDEGLWVQPNGCG